MCPNTLVPWKGSQLSHIYTTPGRCARCRVSISDAWTDCGNQFPKVTSLNTSLAPSLEMQQANPATLPSQPELWITSWSSLLPSSQPEASSSIYTLLSLFRNLYHQRGARHSGKSGSSSIRFSLVSPFFPVKSEIYKQKSLSVTLQGAGHAHSCVLYRWSWYQKVSHSIQNHEISELRLVTFLCNFLQENYPTRRVLNIFAHLASLWWRMQLIQRNHRR